MRKVENRRAAKIEKLKKQKIREEHGEEAAPKGVTKTIESMRVKDETIITDADDEEIKGEQDIDEILAAWYPSHRAFLDLPDQPGAKENFRLRKICVRSAVIHRCNGVLP